MSLLEEINHIEATATQLYSHEQVEAAIQQMAQQINQTLAETNPLVLTVMNGGIITAGKLLALLNFPLTIDSINASRYQKGTRGYQVEWLHKPHTSLKDRAVLIIDDILDEGHTLKALIDYCQSQGATAIYSAVLINKRLAQNKPVKADFVGLEIDDYYVFGYGMDYKGYLRNANGIFACAEECLR